MLLLALGLLITRLATLFYSADILSESPIKYFVEEIQNNQHVEVEVQLFLIARDVLWLIAIVTILSCRLLGPPIGFQNCEWQARCNEMNLVAENGGSLPDQSKPAEPPTPR